MHLPLVIEKEFPIATASLREVGALDDAVFLEDARSWMRDSALRIAVIGEFNAGKSTLINALLGHELLKAGLRPMSAEVTCLQKGAHDEVIEVPETGELKRHSLDELGRLGTLENGQFRQLGVARLDVKLAHFPLPENIVLVDTPGLNDGPEQSKRAERAALLSDMVLLLLNARQVGTQDERAIVEKLRFQNKPLIVVVNHMNLYEAEDERGSVRELLTHWLGETNPFSASFANKGWLEISAIDALRKALGLPHASSAMADFENLKYELETQSSQALGLEEAVLAKRLRVLLRELNRMQQAHTQKLAPLLEEEKQKNEKRQKAAEQAKIGLMRLQQTKDTILSNAKISAIEHLNNEHSALMNWFTDKKLDELKGFALPHFRARTEAVINLLRDLGRDSFSPYLHGTKCEVPVFSIPPYLQRDFKPSYAFHLGAKVGGMGCGSLGCLSYLALLWLLVCLYLPVLGIPASGFALWLWVKHARNQMENSFRNAASEEWANFTAQYLTLFEKEWIGICEAIIQKLEECSRCLPPKPRPLVLTLTKVVSDLDSLRTKIENQCLPKPYETYNHATRRLEFAH